jgi:2-dehydro-3-deoxy-D-arabinonate dehydratase
MLLYRTETGVVVEEGGRYHDLGTAHLGAEAFDALINREDLPAFLGAALGSARHVEKPAALLSPLGNQEIWAAGVTYKRSREARMLEAEQSGGGSFYDRVYDAERPELFFKATPARVVAPGGVMRLRPDSTWMVPEPELTLVVNRRAKIVGYTVGNDLSCRDIEGENPLYLPQAKVFDGCAAIGPGLLIASARPPPETRIELSIARGGVRVFGGSTTLAELKRSLDSLVEFLFRATSFSAGCFLMTGTGIVPGDDFALQPGDEIAIGIDGIGTLHNRVE